MLVFGSAEAPAPPSVVLDEAAQRRLLDRVVRTAARLAAVEPEPEETVLTRVRNALAFLVERTMREMVRDAREGELKALLTDLFGARAAAATVERLRVVKHVNSLPIGALTDCFCSIHGGQFSALNNTRGHERRPPAPSPQADRGRQVSARAS